MTKHFGLNAAVLAVAAATAALCVGPLGGCADTKSQDKPEAKENVAAAAHQAAESGEVKVKLDETPAPVRATIQRELAGAELEDIAKKQINGKTIYETDIIKDGKKWELHIAEDGSMIHKLQEGSAAERAADKAEETAAAVGPGADGFRDRFTVDKSALKPTGDNSYLAIQPGRVLKLTDGKDTLTVTVLPETKTVDGVACGILEEKETKDGKLIEISHNFFATDPATKDVYYFGEDVDNYKDGKIINHESAWQAGKEGARFGLMVPGQPRMGDKFYQEIAPKVAMDRVEIVSTDETVKTPAGTFQHCLHLKETTPIEADVSHKYYAPGVGMIKDDNFELAEKP
jgi:hypothetical protein